MAVLENGENLQTLERLVQVETLRGQPASAATWQRRVLEFSNTTESSLDLVILLTAAEEWDDALAENTALLAELESEFGTTDKRLLPVLELQQQISTGSGQKRQAKKVAKRIKKISR